MFWAHVQWAKDWLKPGCDIYLIGVEECCYTSPPGFSSCFEHWHDLVQSSLPSLLTLCRHDMGHCQILFLATERVSKSIHSVVASHEETGLGGLYSNKGRELRWSFDFHNGQSTKTRVCIYLDTSTLYIYMCVCIYKYNKQIHRYKNK
jgi:hypothetical protein